MLSKGLIWYKNCIMILKKNLKKSVEKDYNNIYLILPATKVGIKK